MDLYGFGTDVREKMMRWLRDEEEEESSSCSWLHVREEEEIDNPGAIKLENYVSFMLNIDDQAGKWLNFETLAGCL